MSTKEELIHEFKRLTVSGENKNRRKEVLQMITALNVVDRPNYVKNELKEFLKQLAELEQWLKKRKIFDEEHEVHKKSMEIWQTITRINEGEPDNS